MEKRLEKRLEDRDLKLSINDEALDFLADVGFDPVYGARPLKRTIQRELETAVARGILSGDFNNGDVVTVGVKNERIDVSKATDTAARPDDSSSQELIFE